MVYFAMYCKKCSRYFMSTSSKHSRCPCCGLGNNSIIESSSSSSVISEYIKQSNVPIRLRKDNYFETFK